MHASNIAITDEGQTGVVEFTQASISDVDSIDAASDQIADFISQQHPQQMLFDFSRVKFFSSQVLGILLKARAQLQETQGQVMVSAVNPQLQRVFKITNLDRIFTFYPNRQSALESIPS